LRRDYTEVGKGFLTHDDIDLAIRTLEFKPYNKGDSLPFSQGMAIQAVINGCKVPNVSAFAVHGWTGKGYGFYGIVARYTNATIRIYLLDNGVIVVPVAMDVWEVTNEEQNNNPTKPV
jgi:hypothetical protein